MSQKYKYTNGVIANRVLSYHKEVGNLPKEAEVIEVEQDGTTLKCKIMVPIRYIELSISLKDLENEEIQD